MGEHARHGQLCRAIKESGEALPDFVAVVSEELAG